MRTSTIILIFILLQSCDSKTKMTEFTTTNISDTTFLNSIKWDSLNKYVDYHVLQEGVATNDTDFYFTVKEIAVYQYLYKSFEQLNNDTTLNLSPNELKEFTLSDSFVDKKGIEYLLRINSHIGYYYRPDLLQTVFVRPNDTSNHGLKSLMHYLKRQTFVQTVSSEINESNMLDDLTKDSTQTYFVKIKLVSNYWYLEKINEICSQLKQRPDIDDAYFTDFFTGLNESEMIYLLKTEKKATNKK